MSQSLKGYNRLAPVYSWLERLAFGSRLMRARLALADKLKHAEKILILGEGDGRLLKRLLLRLPEAQFTCIEQSDGMIRQAKSRLTEDALARVSFVHKNIWDFQTAEAEFDAIVTTFFLDMFSSTDIQRLLETYRLFLKPEGLWYYADFQVVEWGLARLYGQVWLFVLYQFFAWQTGLKTKDLVNPYSLFVSAGFKLRQQKVLSFHLLTSRIYQKV